MPVKSDKWKGVHVNKKKNQNRKCILSHFTLQNSHARKARLSSTYGIKRE